eukprot:TRINITY_DN3332_c0_g3_i2.p1 TRINITY_DN3332_c0_g3~~TRINITY_DN3332_c0_g3_i2.p1  ORF type:complete len:200 (+),score=22.41 TRINITY_DN3332_c0_g3_i2:3-602(+)
MCIRDRYQRRVHGSVYNNMSQLTGVHRSRHSPANDERLKTMSNVSNSMSARDLYGLAMTQRGAEESAFSLSNIAEDPKGHPSSVVSPNPVPTTTHFEEYEKQDAFYEEIYENLQKNFGDHATLPEEIAMMLKTNGDDQFGGLPTFESFKIKFKKVVFEHRRCGRKCPHLGRFYARIGWVHPKNRKPMYEIHKKLSLIHI